MIQHPISPVYDEKSEILILGSFPSVMSRQINFFYGHPQNRFWRVCAAVYDESVPETIRQKRDFLLRNRIALWDVIASCDIIGSSDSTIRNVMPNDLGMILDHADIKRIFINGRTAYKYYQKYTKPVIGRDAVCLPSTSPANAAWNMERLTEAWQMIRE